MDRVWKLPQKRIAEEDCRRAASDIASGYQGIRLEVESEAPDCLSFFFTLPTSEEERPGSIAVEISIYDTGGTVVLSLEPDAADNNAYWDQASQLAEDIADRLNGSDLVL